MNPTASSAADYRKPNHLPLPFGLRFLRRLPLPRKLGLLERLYGRVLAPHGITWVECSNGVWWKLDLGDPCERWILYGDYEGPAALNWIRRWMKGGGVFVDSGANIGQMLLYVAPLPGIKVLAFEPLPEAMAWLRECVAHYASRWHVELIEKGLSDSVASVTLQRSGAQSTLRHDWYQSQELDQVGIQVVRLDDELASRGVEHVRLWKLDVEGVEVQALKGAIHSLSKGAVDAILVEVCAPNLVEVRQLLSGHGYSLYMIGRAGQLITAPEILSVTTNLVALSPRAQNEIAV